MLLERMDDELGKGGRKERRSGRGDVACVVFLFSILSFSRTFLSKDLKLLSAGEREREGEARRCH